MQGIRRAVEKVDGDAGAKFRIRAAFLDRRLAFATTARTLSRSAKRVPARGTTLAARPAQFIQGLGLWLPANCSGVPCTYVSSPTAVDVAVLWNGLATTATGASVFRNAASDTNSDSDWEVGPQTIGSSNF